MKLEIGIEENDRKNIAHALAALLADSYTLYLKTHNYHWNVTGPMFQTLHTMFETQYTELALAVDVIAERIRALGHFAPGSYGAYAELATVKDEGGVPPALTMVKNLVIAHEAVIRTARKVGDIAGKASDHATEDLATQRLQLHEKTAWMLRSLLAEEQPR